MTKSLFYRYISAFFSSRKNQSQKLHFCPENDDFIRNLAITFESCYGQCRQIAQNDALSYVI